MRPNCDKQYERVCQREFISLHDKLDKLDEAIRGNGRPGIQRRLDRLELAAAARSRVLWIIASAVLALAVGALWKLFFGA